MAKNIKVVVPSSSSSSAAKIVPIPNDTSNTASSTSTFAIWALRVSVVFLTIVLFFKLQQTVLVGDNNNNGSNNQNNANNNYNQYQQQQKSVYQQQSIDLSSSVYQTHHDHHHGNTNNNNDKQQQQQQQSSTNNAVVTHDYYSSFVADLIEDHLGPLSGAFDLELVFTIAKAQSEAFFKKSSQSSVDEIANSAPAATVLPCAKEASTQWKIDYRRAIAATPPTCLSSWKEGLSTVKFYTSLALSRLVHDAELEEMFNALSNVVEEAKGKGEPRVESAARDAFAEFKFSVAKVISGHVHHAISAVQTLFEGYRPSAASGGADFLLNEFLNARISISDFVSSSSSSSSSSKKKQQQQQQQTASDTSTSTSSSSSSEFLGKWLSKRISTSVKNLLSVSGVDYYQQQPIEGKFWNILRNEIGCSTLERSCESPEGCRYICNREYLLRAGGGGNSYHNKNKIEACQYPYSYVKSSSNSVSGGEQEEGSKKIIVSSAEISSSTNFRSHNDTIAVLNAVFGINNNNNNMHQKSNNNNNIMNNNDKQHEKEDQNTNNNNFAQQQHFTSSFDPACVQLVSLGSNNEFDWEDSMIKLLRSTGTPLAGISTFDCTLATGLKPSPTLSKLISENQDLFHFYPFCIGVADPEVDVFSPTRRIAKEFHAARRPSAAAISLAELDSLLKNEQVVTEEHRVGVFKKTKRDDLAPFVASFVGKFPGKRVSILKMDIESFEFVAVPRWLQIEMALIGNHQKRRQRKRQEKKGTNNKINNNNNDDDVVDHGHDAVQQQQTQTTFDFSSVPIINVEQIQTEIHRRGHKNKKAANFVGAMWLQWLLLNYHALGFLTVSNEKNHVDNCCFEAVLVHYRYFIASQSWNSASVSQQH